MINLIKDILKRNLPSSVLKNLIKAQYNFIRLKDLLWIFLFNKDKRSSYKQIHSHYKSIENKGNVKFKNTRIFGDKWEKRP